MRTSAEHTPPFVDYGPGESPWQTAYAEVVGLRPAVLAWMKDEIGEDHFLALTRAAMQGDEIAIDRARDDIIERWAKADRAFWIKKVAK